MKRCVSTEVSKAQDDAFFHLYTVEVVGSNPAVPTIKLNNLAKSKTAVTSRREPFLLALRRQSLPRLRFKKMSRPFLAGSVGLA
jgi:hypothetical protein